MIVQYMTKKTYIPILMILSNYGGVYYMGTSNKRYKVQQNGKVLKRPNNA